LYACRTVDDILSVRSFYQCGVFKHMDMIGMFAQEQVSNRRYGY
jgi:hypothetical protein